MLNKISMCIFLLCLNTYSFAETKIPHGVLADLKRSASLDSGDILYIDFWASWCTPCRKSFPWMNSMVSKYGAQGLKILAINVDKDRALADAFLTNTKVTFPIVYDPKGDLAKLFQLKGMPSSFIIKADGTLLKAHKGFFEGQTLNYENDIQKLLAL